MEFYHGKNKTSIFFILVYQLGVRGGQPSWYKLPSFCENKLLGAPLSLTRNKIDAIPKLSLWKSEDKIESPRQITIFPLLTGVLKLISCFMKNDSADLESKHCT